MTEAVFEIGEPVAKVGGDYRFDGWVVGHMWKRSGELRYAVEDDRGVLHIFNERQICRRQEIDANVPAAGRPFKVGDRVRVVKALVNLSAADGKTGVVTMVDVAGLGNVLVDLDESVPIDGGVTHYEIDQCLVSPDRIEHLDPAPPAQDAVPAAGEAERLAANLLGGDDARSDFDADIREAATLLMRLAELIRTLVGALSPVASKAVLYDRPEQGDNWIVDVRFVLGELRKICAALDAARAMGFGKEGE